ncbi:MAG: hypothetical protein QMD99_23430, partial [Rhizobiaceae bacterium]|nr:hypothetical protein [Rhizobiaceae bacterium]
MPQHFAIASHKRVCSGFGFVTEHVTSNKRTRLARMLPRDPTGFEMEEFHKVRRLPPYVFEQVNRLKASA